MISLFDFFSKDWKEEWIEEAIKGDPKWYKLDNRTSLEFIELEKLASKKGLLKLSLSLEELRKVRKIYGWQ